MPTKAELIEQAENAGLDIPTDATKAQLTELLDGADGGNAGATITCTVQSGRGYPVATRTIDVVDLDEDLDLYLRVAPHLVRDDADTTRDGRHLSGKFGRLPVVLAGSGLTEQDAEQVTEQVIDTFEAMLADILKANRKAYE